MLKFNFVTLDSFRHLEQLNLDNSNKFSEKSKDIPKFKTVGILLAMHDVSTDRRGALVHYLSVGNTLNTGWHTYRVSDVTTLLPGIANLTCINSSYFVKGKCLCESGFNRYMRNHKFLSYMYMLFCEMIVDLVVHGQ